MAEQKITQKKPDWYTNASEEAPAEKPDWYKNATETGLPNNGLPTTTGSEAIPLGILNVLTLGNTANIAGRVAGAGRVAAKYLTEGKPQTIETVQKDWDELSKAPREATEEYIKRVREENPKNWLGGNASGLALAGAGGAKSLFQMFGKAPATEGLATGLGFSTPQAGSTGLLPTVSGFLKDSATKYIPGAAAADYVYDKFKRAMGRR